MVMTKGLPGGPGGPMGPCAPFGPRGPGGPFKRRKMYMCQTEDLKGNCVLGV